MRYVKREGKKQQKTENKIILKHKIKKKKKDNKMATNKQKMS